MASFQAKVGWKRMRKKENKNYSSVSFLSDAYLKITKKLKNTNGFILSQNWLGTDEKQ